MSSGGGSAVGAARPEARGVGSFCSEPLAAEGLPQVQNKEKSWKFLRNELKMKEKWKKIIIKYHKMNGKRMGNEELWSVLIGRSAWGPNGLPTCQGLRRVRLKCFARSKDDRYEVRRSRFHSFPVSGAAFVADCERMGVAKSNEKGNEFKKGLKALKFHLKFFFFFLN